MSLNSFVIAGTKEDAYLIIFSKTDQAYSPYLSPLSIRPFKSTLSDFISIFLELAHLVIPNRSFQFSDLFGNIIGLLISIFILKIYKYLEKK